ncbi:hypothetical protein GSI_14824 [Ganoderma sinense ZZ0214-1]|uniref:Uncharacterized protein n=1 Tax=Ganoderma sinense ZZ0214-1 TaxID=1077348 RepID=A0A2G8RPS9_9APHY|nr:hypothetical protein GSI_14824 [Ganoderma sinense ZZ0214-1]
MRWAARRGAGARYMHKKLSTEKATEGNRGDMGSFPAYPSQTRVVEENLPKEGGAWGSFRKEGVQGHERQNPMPVLDLAHPPRVDPPLLTFHTTAQLALQAPLSTRKRAISKSVAQTTCKPVFWEVLEGQGFTSKLCTA